MVTARKRSKPSRYPDPPPGWLTRELASDLVCCSYNTLKNWEIRGLLHALTCENPETLRPATYYDPVELARVPLKRNSLRNALPAGEIAGQAFELFEAGKTNRETVIALRSDPATVEDLRQQWLECGERIWTLSAATRAQLAEVVGTFADEIELVARVREIANANANADAASEVAP